MYSPKFPNIDLTLFLTQKKKKKSNEDTKFLRMRPHTHTYIILIIYNMTRKGQKKKGRKRELAAWSQ